MEADLHDARRRGCSYVEMGGWVIAEALRCTTEALRMIATAYAFAQLCGGALGISTASTRRCSSAILKRIGGQQMRAGGVELPSFYDAHYRCHMEVLLRFVASQPALSQVDGRLPFGLEGCSRYLPGSSGRFGNMIASAWQWISAPLLLGLLLVGCLASLRLGDAPVLRSAGRFDAWHAADQDLWNRVRGAPPGGHCSNSGRQRGARRRWGRALFWGTGTVLVGNPNQLAPAVVGGILSGFSRPPDGARSLSNDPASPLLLLPDVLAGRMGRYRPLVAGSDHRNHAGRLSESRG